MKYKILLKNENSEYFKFYQISSADGDWQSADKEETIAKLKELIEEYPLSSVKPVISLDVDIELDIPELPAQD